MPTSPDVSVVVPVFNSAGTLRTLFAAIQHESTVLNVNADVIFVDDGSTDDSWRVILELNVQHGSRVRGVRLARNCGQQAATYCGLLEADGEWVVTIDDDLQAHPREIRKLWEHAQAAHADVVYGVYATLEHGLVHRIGSRLFRMLLRRLAPAFPDGSSFRLIRASVVRSIPRAPGPWVLVDPILARHTSDFTSVVVEHGRRETGRSGYSFPRLFGMACTLLFTYSRIPLRLMTGIGLISAMSSFALGLYYLFQKLTADAQIGFSALIVTITFSSGVILLSLGILGEYISRLHAMGSGEAAFTIKARALV
jgi:polyisoprenyl-phosphate glycosyltransferase